MMRGQFSQKVSTVLAYSREEAVRLQNPSIGPGHLLLGLIRDGEGRAIDVLRDLSVDLGQIKSQLEEKLLQNDICGETGGKVASFPHINDLVLNEEANRLLLFSALEARGQHKTEACIVGNIERR